MAEIYEQNSSIYDEEVVEQGLSENVAAPKAAYTVLASGSNTPETPRLIGEVYRELTGNTTSTTEQQLTGQAVEEFERGKRAVSISVAKSDMPVEERVSAVEDAATAEYTPNLVMETELNQSSLFDPRDESEADTHRRRARDRFLRGTAETLLYNVEFRSAIQELQTEVQEQLGDPGFLEGAGELAEIFALPGVTGDAYSSLAKNLFPEEASRITGFLAPGEAQVFLREKFQNMSPEERDEMLPLLRDELVDTAGIVSDNGFLAQMMLNEVFSEELGLRDEDDFDWDRLWNNATGILDSTVILSGIGKLGFGLAKSRAFNKVISSVDRANPQAARDLRAALLASDDVEDVTTMTGMTREDALVDIYPTFSGAFNSTVPAGIVDEISKIQVNLKKIEEDIAFGINYTQDEIATMQSRVLDAYTDMQGSYNHSFSEFRVLEDEGKGFKVKAAIGASDDVGFNNYDEAVTHFERNFPEGTQVDFMVRDGDVVREAVEGDFDVATSSGTYSRARDARRGAVRAGQPNADVVLDEDTGRYFWQTGAKEVWYRVEQDYNYNVGLLDENTLLFGGNVIESGSSASEAGAFASRFLLDPASRFDRLTAKAASRANDLGQGIRGRMLQQYQRGFLSLPRQGQMRVLDAIDRGSELERNFDYHELVGMGMSESEILGYYRVRGIMDLEWNLNNTRVYNTLKRDNYESVVNYNTGFEEFGRRLDRGQVEFNAGKVEVFDPDTNQIIRMSSDDIDTLYENGGQVLKSRSVLSAGGRGVTQIASGLGDGTRIRPLTLNPLKYRPGYVTRFYDENYFVKMRKTEIIDGVKRERLITVAAAPTNPEAVRLIEALQRQNPDADFVKQLDQNLDRVTQDDTEFEYLHRTGGIITGRRGDILKGLDEASAKTIDPVQSMMDSISYTASRVSHDDTIASLERRWVNTYGSKFGGHTTVPSDIKAIKGDTPTAKGVQKARDHAAYIQALKGAQGDGAQSWKSAMISIAEHVDNLFDGGRKTKGLTDLVRNFNPMKLMRGATFNILLASNPSRQLLLQANQITFLTGMAPKYVVGGEMARDFTAFAVAAATRQRDIWGTMRPRLAKIMKMSEKDFEALYDGYVRSGLPFSIDSHTFARDGLTELSKRITGGPVARAGRAAGNAVKMPLRAAKQVGFDAGEYANLTMTWLVAWKDWQKKNPGRSWKSKAAFDDISTEARDLSLNMTRSGELPYQRGALSLATQFLSYQHKAMLALAGKNKAYASLTRNQKVGMVASQFLLYGVDGFGLGTRWDKIKDSAGLDVPDSVNAILDGLVYEYMLNASINALTQDGTDIDFSSALAPASGVLGSFEDLIGSLMTMDLPSTLLGASTSTISRVDQAMRTVGTVWEIPDLSSPERLEATLQQAGQIFGGYSNWVKGEAMKSIGYAVNNNGQPLFKATYAEGLAKALFGINPESQDDYYRILQGVNGEFTGQGFLETIGGPGEEDIDAIAETYYDRVLKIFRELSYEDIDGRDDLWYNQLQAKIALENTVMAVLPSDVAFAVKRRINDRIDRNINTTGVDDLVQYMTRAVLGGTESLSTREHYINMIKNADFKLSEQQNRDVEALIDYMIDTEGLE